MIIEEVKMRKQNRSLAWIDYKKAYDVVSYLWIIGCFEAVGVNEKIKRLVTESMKS